MKIDVQQAADKEQDLLAALFQLYRYDFTEFTGDDVGDDGRFDVGRLPMYWSDPSRWPFVLRVDGHPAGFALVRRGEALDDGGDVMDVAEFFVMRKYRRHRAGEGMATQLFRRFPGRWQVREMQENLPAQAFWRTIIRRYTGGRFDEIRVDDDRWRGPVQYFVSPGE